MIVYRCDACGEPIADGEGYLHLVGLREAEPALKQFSERCDELVRAKGFLSLREIGECPPRAQWVAHHERCDPDPDGGEYWMAVERVRTHQRVISWTAHLMEKNWFEYTNWGGFLRSVVSPADLNI